MIEIGLKHTSELTVTDAVTAIQMGSGDMPVLATPAMLALMENTAMLAVADELPEGCTTVGGHIESSHLKPSKIGDTEIPRKSSFEAYREFLELPASADVTRTAVMTACVLCNLTIGLHFVVTITRGYRQITLPYCAIRQDY